MAAPSFCPTGTWNAYTWITYIAAGGGTGSGPTYTPASPNIECLPNSGAGFPTSALDSNGNLITGAGSTLDTHITTLLTNAGAVPPSVDPATGSLTSLTATSGQTPVSLADTFAKNAAKLRTSLVTEYCFHHAAYVFALKQLLTAATSPGLVNSSGVIPSTAEVYGTTSPVVSIKYGNLTSGLMGDVYKLNTKLNQMIQMMKRLQEVRWSSLNTNYYGVFSDSSSKLNKPLDDVQKNLKAVSTTLTKGDFEMSAKQSMIDYTMEKNSSSRNLLAVYGFMNIVAVGLLFYMYKAAK